MATILITLGFTIYMLLAPARAVRRFMQLTKTKWDFELLLLALGMTYFCLSYIGERFIFAQLARFFGKVQRAIGNRPKTRKQYKVISEDMRI